MGARANYSAIVVGRKFTGKSTFLEVLARKYPKNKRVLIIDVNGSPAYKKYQLLSERLFLAWMKSDKKGIKRFYDSDHKKMMEFVSKNFNNGFVIFEDCTKYIDPNPEKLIKTFLVDHRMWNVDLMFTFHALEFVPRFFWKMINYVTIFKTQDIVEGREREFQKRIPNFKVVNIAYQNVKNHSSPYYNETVETLI